MDFFQILVVASPGRFAQTFFFFFSFLNFFFIFYFFFVFLRKFFVSVNMGHYGSQHFKTLFLPQITIESFQTFSTNFFSVVLTKVLFWIFEMLSF